MTEFKNLPHSQNPHGELRRVGIEMEMADISLDVIAGSIVDLFGGVHQQESPFEHHVTGTRFGDFGLELDSDLLKRREYLDYLENMGVEIDRDTEPHALESALSQVAGLVVPHEVVAPPIPHDALPELDRLRQRLQQEGAKGTHGSLFYAFGLQINLELARLDADYILHHLQAFMLLYDWLLSHSQADLSRRLTPFVDPFPEDYPRLILDSGYRPDLSGLINDYLAHNPTRNRPLDMLPLFAHLSQEQIDAAPVEHHLIRPRPTFHYRLPDCRIDEPDWDLSVPWNAWVAVERLASDPQRLGAMAREYLTAEPETLASKGQRWVEKVTDWLRN
ncbi:amidoligase family protein [Ectothiorhodospira haloalkaliphila]|uniref:amidoligase family protein n=1 Tax=Ectothiorhodospira TaxID=1051 RepID=UPI001EE99881|nr:MULTISPECIES: amidoligase family protein [Ectothiorhodospira]MCG5496281.1 amidoligase family protein [Ectothiorhodospira variabilis]MCG5523784.1 amidoligase family protein [Ectothiorhodospira haloalkaliphila]